MQASIASLSLVLTLTVAIAPTPHGIPVRLATEYTNGGTCEGDPGDIIIAADGSFTLNGKPTDQTNLARQLHEKFRTKAVHWVFLQADPAATFQTVMTIIAIAKSEADQVAIMPSAPDNIKCWTIAYPPDTIAEPKPPIIEPKKVPLWPHQ